MKNPERIKQRETPRVTGNLASGGIRHGRHLSNPIAGGNDENHLKAIVNQTVKIKLQPKDNQMKTIKCILTLAAAAALLTGCATNRSNTGAMGDDREVGTVASSDYDEPGASSQLPMGPNSSVGPGNPFGLGPGSGLERAH